MSNSKNLTLKTSAMIILLSFVGVIFLYFSISTPALVKTKAAASSESKESKSVTQIKRAISSLSKKMSDRDSRELARSIYEASKKHHINPKLMVAILMQESSFDQTKVSRTGDISISQINYQVWSREFSRLKKAPLDRFRLSMDRDYAIFRMAEILEILSKRQDKDSSWYAVYHSKTPSNKFMYVSKVNQHLNRIERL